MSLLAASFVYALLSLDQIALGPFLLARPIVSGALVGLATGDAGLGFSAGLAAELLFIAVPPVGLTSSDVSVVGALAAYWAVSSASQREGVLLLALILAAPWAGLVTRLDLRIRAHNDRFAEWVLGHLREGRERVLWKALSAWALLWVLKAAAVFTVIGGLGRFAVEGLVAALPMPVLDALDGGARCLPAAGFAAAAAFFWSRLNPRRMDADGGPLP